MPIFLKQANIQIYNILKSLIGISRTNDPFKMKGPFIVN